VIGSNQSLCQRLVASFSRFAQGDVHRVGHRAGPFRKIGVVGEVVGGTPRAADGRCAPAEDGAEVHLKQLLELEELLHRGDRDAALPAGDRGLDDPAEAPPKFRLGDPPRLTSCSQHPSESDSSLVDDLCVLTSLHPLYTYKVVGGR
jgi:hypothetical protein